MIATRGYGPPARVRIGFCSVFILLAAAPPPEAKCTESTISEFATATSREAAERNAAAKLAQKLKKRGIDAARVSGKPKVECKQPLMWQCTAEVKACLYDFEIPAKAGIW